MAEKDGFFNTTERGTAWIFRGVLMLLVGSFTLIGYFANNTLTDIKKQGEAAVSTITTLTQAQSTTTTNLSVLSQTVSDNIKEQSRIEASLQAIEQDHETRIRSLEHH
jgi:hypothetical protein